MRKIEELKTPGIWMGRKEGSGCPHLWVLSPSPPGRIGGGGGVEGVKLLLANYYIEFCICASNLPVPSNLFCQQHCQQLNESPVTLPAINQCLPAMLPVIN